MRDLLLLEDDLLFGETLVDFLDDEGFCVHWVTTGQEALDATYQESYRLYLLDVNVPPPNGFELLRMLRESSDTTPTIFITSAKERGSVLEGFATGGDDYIKKPVDLDEMRLRIEALLRRCGFEQSAVIGDFRFDAKKQLLYRDEAIVPLAQKARELLGLLLEHRGKVVEKALINQMLYGNDEASEGAVRVYINTLKQVFGKEAITNIRGVGYRFEA